MCVLVESDSLQLHGQQPARLLCLWDFSGKNTGVGCQFLLQGIFPTQGSNPRLLCLLHGQVDSLPLSHLKSPELHADTYISQYVLMLFSHIDYHRVLTEIPVLYRDSLSVTCFTHSSVYMSIQVSQLTLKGINC